MMYLLSSHKKKNTFFASMELDPYPEADPDPDPLVRGTDPGVRIRIRTKMSRITNTAFKKCSRTAEIVMAAYCASLHH